MTPVELTNSEWYVMDCLWERSPQSVMELVAALGQQAGWAKSTTITVLRRMEEKGLLGFETRGRSKVYWPLVDRQAALRTQTRSFLDRVYRGSVGLMVSSLIDDKSLSKEELDELYALLQKAEEGAK